MNTNSNKPGGLETIHPVLGQGYSARADAGNPHGMETGMTSPIQITLPWPAKALHSNARVHWAVEASAKKKARHEAALVTRRTPVGCWADAEILIEYYPPSMRGDPQNVPSSLKAYIDGIADAMGCDDKRFRVDYPRVFAGTRKGGEVVFRIYPNSLARAGE